jgi:serine protease Do
VRLESLVRLAQGLSASLLFFFAPRLAHAAEPKSVGPLWNQGDVRSSSTIPLADLVSRSRSAVVQVRGQLSGSSATSAGGKLSVGTGFVISSTGYIVTNEHVVRDSERLQVRMSDGRELDACVQGFDATTDIALLKVRSLRPLDVLPLGDPSSVRAGDPVFVIGNPFGFDHSVSAGILSAKDRIVERQSASETTTTAPYAFYLQTDAAINMGNSGGPLLSRQGFVIGVASAFWGGAQPAQGIGFAIPIDVVKQMLPQLAARGHVSRSKVGVDVQSVDPSLAEAFALQTTRGALLAFISPKGPGDLAGFRAGDLIVAWGEHSIAGVEDFKIYAQLTPPGQRVNVRLLRDGKSIKTSLVTEAASAVDVALAHAANCETKATGALPILGIDFAHKPAEGGGLVVRTVVAGSARQAGLLPGDVILQINNLTLKEPADIVRGLRHGKRANPILVRREDSNFWVALPAHSTTASASTNAIPR